MQHATHLDSEWQGAMVSEVHCSSCIVIFIGPVLCKIHYCGNIATLYSYSIPSHKSTVYHTQLRSTGVMAMVYVWTHTPTPMHPYMHDTHTHTHIHSCTHTCAQWMDLGSKFCCSGSVRNLACSGNWIHVGGALKQIDGGVKYAYRVNANPCHKN